MSWHADSSLEPFSSIAVLNLSLPQGGSGGKGAEGHGGGGKHEKGGKQGKHGKGGKGGKGGGKVRVRVRVTAKVICLGELAPRELGPAALAALALCARELPRKLARLVEVGEDAPS